MNGFQPYYFPISPWCGPYTWFDHYEPRPRLVIYLRLV